MSRHGKLFHLDEPLYTKTETDTRKSGEKNFDYVDPKNRTVQIEMEKALYGAPEAIGAYLAPDEFDEVDFRAEDFPLRGHGRHSGTQPGPHYRRCHPQRAVPRKYQISISTLSWRTIIPQTERRKPSHVMPPRDPRVVHLIPERGDLGIGGC